MYNDILFPVDLNHESSWIRALPVAVAYCQAYGVRLHVITVLPDFGMSIVGDYFPEDFKQQTRDDADQQLHAFNLGARPGGCSGPGSRGRGQGLPGNSVPG